MEGKENPMNTISNKAGNRRTREQQTPQEKDRNRV
jgi:hypothetical protein